MTVDRDKLRSGDIVYVNPLPDARPFEVLEVNGLAVTVRQYHADINYIPQVIPVEIIHRAEHKERTAR